MPGFNEGHFHQEMHQSEFSRMAGASHHQGEALHAKAAAKGFIHGAESIALHLLPLVGLYAGYKLMMHPHEKRS